MKLFEYTLLERILPVLQENGHPALTQTAYRKDVSCQDAIFSTQEAIKSILRNGNTAFLSLYDLEKALDSIEHPVLLHSLFHAGINGRSWRLFRAWYSNLSALVRFKSVTSPSIPVHRGVQQGSVLSPTFFLVVMDKLLLQLSDERCGISICGLYLGGAAHADDVRTIASSAAIAEVQGGVIFEFAHNNGLLVNREKTEVVRMAVKKCSNENQVQLTYHNSTVSTLPQTKCLGFMSLSAKPGVEQNVNRARKQFFALGSTGCFLGYSNPLSAREIVDICVIPTLLYGAENWILDDISLNLLERFQAELGRRILKLSKHHSSLSTMIVLSWPTMKSRILRCKLRFLGKLISDDRDNIATRTFRMIGSQNVYDISIVQQCIFLVYPGHKVNRLPPQ